MSCRDGMLYTPEMSRRARSVELWATLKYLGKSGVQSIVDSMCDNAKYFAQRLSENGFEVLNDIVFNQILIKCETAHMTRTTLKISNAAENAGVAGRPGATNLSSELVFALGKPQKMI